MTKNPNRLAMEFSGYPNRAISSFNLYLSQNPKLKLSFVSTCSPEAGQICITAVFESSGSIDGKLGKELLLETTPPFLKEQNKDS